MAQSYSERLAVVAAHLNPLRSLFSHWPSAHDKDASDADEPGTVRPIAVLGAAILDLQARPTPPYVLQRGTSTPGTLTLTPGGVGRNIAEALARLRPSPKPRLISLLGDDKEGSFLLEGCRDAGIDTRWIHVAHDLRTPTVTCLFSSDGEVYGAVADVAAVERGLSDSVVRSARVRGCIASSSLLVLDGNLEGAALAAAAGVAAEHRVDVLYEPVSVAKAPRCAAILRDIRYMKPNGEELAAIAAGIRRLRGAGSDKGFPLLSPPAWPFSWPNELRETVLEYLPDIAAVLHEGTTGIFLTLGALGALYCSREDEASGSGPQHSAASAASAAVGVGQGPATEPAARRHGEREVLVSVWHTPAIRVPVVSLVGAGDCFVAGAAVALASGHGPLQALADGVAAATLSVQSLRNVPSSLTPSTLHPYAEAAKRAATSTRILAPVVT